MFKLLRNKKAQNTMEYALLIAIVIGSFTAMRLYLGRGLNARVREGADNIPATVFGQVADADAALLPVNPFGTREQYEPYYSRTSEYGVTSTTSSGSEAGTETALGGRRDVAGATSTTIGAQGIGAVPADGQDPL